MSPRYRVTLTEQERNELDTLTKKWNRYPEAVKVRLVMDNLNTHSIASLYETFDPKEARGQTPGGTTRYPLHAQARELVEYSGD